MSYEFDPQQVQRFVAAAKTRQLLNDEQADTLVTQSHQRMVPPGQCALDVGLLTPTDIEITEAFIDPDDLVPGYRLLDVLGTGALGVVYRARQDGLGRDVAIKTILQARLMQSNVLSRFHQESAAIGRLQHPNIVAAYDSGSHRGRVYLVMEYVKGSDLSSWIREKPLSVEHSLSLARQTALGLANALSHGIVHRDIKPANLMVTEAPTGYDILGGAPLVKIADFGLARFNSLGDASEDQTRLTMTGAALGTPMYGAPEQLTGDAADHRADIYGLGTTLFSMLSGQPPFAQQKLHALITTKISGEEPQMERLPPGTSAGVRKLIIDMTKSDPEERIGDYASLIERIDELTDDQAARPRRSSVAPSAGAGTSSRSGRGKLAWLAGALGVMVLACGAGILWWQTQSGAASLPALAETGWSESLFDGEDVSGWRSQTRSSTRDQEDAEGAKVMAVTGATLKTNVPLPPEFLGAAADRSGATTGFGFNIIVDLQDAQSAEVHFGFSGKQHSDMSRHVVQIAADEIRLGTRQNDDAEFQSDVVGTESVGRMSDQSTKRCEVKIRWFASRWSVLVNENEIGVVRAASDEVIDAIGLAAIGGEAYFADLFVFGIRAAEVPPG